MLSAVPPNRICSNAATGFGAVSSGSGSNGRVIPFGRPVVPLEYNMSVPATRCSSRGSGECAATASSYDS
jgi:hypothetical protein